MSVRRDPSQLSPHARALLQSGAHHGLSRRRFLGGLGVGAAALSMGGVLAACGTAPTGQPSPGQASPEPVEDLSDSEKLLVISNWQLYIDQRRGGRERPTLEAFEEQTGVRVDYTEDVTDNETFYAKISPQLAAGQPTGRDIIVMTDWIVPRFIRQGYVLPLDRANTPNYPANLLPSLTDAPIDPEREYSAPWQSGLTGIAYNAKLTGEVRTITELFTRPELQGKVTALLEMRDTMGLILAEQGVDPASDFTADDFAAAIDVLQAAVDDGQIRQFTGNEYSEGLASGDIAACIAWSGDVIQLQLDNPDLRFVVPEAGCMLWSDNMLIPAGARHKKNAELWINHYYDPAVAAELAAWVNYICPVAGAQEAMRELDPELADNELIFPTEATLATTRIFRSLSEEEEQDFTRQFNAVAGA